MKIKVLDRKALPLAGAVFAKEYNETLVHQVVVAYMATGRSGTKAQKSRSQVRGGGAKPWRQKGTGRARAGTSRGPIWRKGGVTFAAEVRDFSKKINKKMYREAMRSIFSELERCGSLLVVDDFSMSKPDTKKLRQELIGLGATSALLVNDSVDSGLGLSIRNIPNCEQLAVSNLNPVSLISHDKVLVTSSAVVAIQEWLQ